MKARLQDRPIIKIKLNFKKFNLNLNFFSSTSFAQTLSGVFSSVGAFAAGQIDERQLTDANDSFVLYDLLAFAIERSLNETNSKNAVRTARLGVEGGMSNATSPLTALKDFKSFFSTFDFDFRRGVDVHIFVTVLAHDFAL